MERASTQGYLIGNSTISEESAFFLLVLNEAGGVLSAFQVEFRCLIRIRKFNIELQSQVRV